MTRIAMVESNMSGTGFQALQIARELGVGLVFVTRNLDLYRGVPGVAELFERYVDEVVTCETNDAESLAAVLGDYHHRRRLDGVMTFGEYHIAATSLACRRLGLRGPDPQAVQTARNKDRMRAACAEAGVPMPCFAVVSGPDDAAEAAHRIGYPCVIKPANESGSIDVTICFDGQEVRNRAGLILATPMNYRGQLRSPLMLVEEYLLGPEVSVETVTQDGRTDVVGVTDKQIGALPHFVEMGHAFPSALPDKVVAACRETAVAAVAAIGYDLGVAHVEMKLTADGPCLIEVNPRPAGDRIPDLIEASTGISLAREAMRICLGEPADLRPTRQRAAAVRFAGGYPGRISRILGVDLARSMPEVLDVGLEVTVGGSVRRLTDAHARVAYVIAGGETTYQACHAAEAALVQIMVETV